MGLLIMYVYNNKSLFIIFFLCLWVYINKWLVLYAYMSYKFNLLQFHVFLPSNGDVSTTESRIASLREGSRDV